MKHSLLILILFVSAFGSASSRDKSNGNGNRNASIENTSDDSNMMSNKIKIKVNSKTFTATLLDNNSANAFIKMLPMTINMKELNGDEKYHDLPNRLPTNASNPRTIQTGDLMLFGSKTLVLFYKASQTSYSYTRLGRIDNPAGLAAALGSGSATVTFEMQ
jgi:hypothetical protein